MKTTYITVNTVNKNDGYHIGTIKATNDSELNEKLKLAMDSHFDADTIFENQTLDSVKNGNTKEFKINFNLEDFTEQIEIMETWLY